MAAIDTLRTNTLATLTAMEADGTGLTATQQQGIDDLQANIAAEQGLPNAANIAVTDSWATNIPYGLRTAAKDMPVITSALTVNGTHGVALSTYTITATNTPTSFAAQPLPAGLSLVPATGAITGTPTTAGSYRVFVTATNANGTSAQTPVIFNIA